jgi:hypothetical protein
MILVRPIEYWLRLRLIVVAEEKPGFIQNPNLNLVPE